MAADPHMTQNDGSTSHGPTDDLAPDTRIEPGLKAARILLEAAKILGEKDHTPATARLRRVAWEFEEALNRPSTDRQLHDVSPFVIMRDGSRKSILAMIEESQDRDSDRLRLAQLLLRSLEWRSPR